MPDDFNSTKWITTAEAAKLTGYHAVHIFWQKKPRCRLRKSVAWVTEVLRHQWLERYYPGTAEDDWGAFCQ